MYSGQKKFESVHSGNTETCILMVTLQLKMTAEWNLFLFLWQLCVSVCGLLLKAVLLLTATTIETNQSSKTLILKRKNQSLEPTLTEMLLKELRCWIFPLFFSWKMWLWRNGLSLLHPQKNKIRHQGLIRFSVCLWLKNYAEILCTRDHTEPL